MLYPCRRQASQRRILTLAVSFRPTPHRLNFPRQNEFSPSFQFTALPLPTKCRSQAASRTLGNHPCNTTPFPAAARTDAEKWVCPGFPPQNQPTYGHTALSPQTSTSSGNVAYPAAGSHISPHLVSSKAITRAGPTRHCRRCRRDTRSTVRAWMDFFSQ